MSGEQRSDTPRTDRVIVLVWDGMRPDYVTQALTPNLHALERQFTEAQNFSYQGFASVVGHWWEDGATVSDVFNERVTASLGAIAMQPRVGGWFCWRRLAAARGATGADFFPLRVVMSRDYRRRD